MNDCKEYWDEVTDMLLNDEFMEVIWETYKFVMEKENVGDFISTEILDNDSCSS